MKNRSIFTLILWVAIALLMFKACNPDSAAPSETAASGTEENFDYPAPEDYPLVLENELIQTNWSATGASCGKVSLKRFANQRPENDLDIPQEDWLVLMDSSRVLGKLPSGNAGDYHYRTRDAFQLRETSGLLFPDQSGPAIPLEGIEWTVEQKDDRHLVFTLDTPSGIRVRKLLSLEPNSYHIDSSIELIPLTEEAARKSVSLRLSTGGSILKEHDPFYQNPYAGAGLKDNGVLDELDIYYPSGSLPAPGETSRSRIVSWNGDIPFVVEGSKYFLNAIRAMDRDFRGASAELLHDDAYFLEEAQAKGEHRVTSPHQSDAWRRTSVAGAFVMRLGNANESQVRRFQWYLGPKSTDTLTEGLYGDMAELPSLADFGSSFFYRMFGTEYVAPTILWIVSFFQSLVGNWGVAIILMTLLVRSLLFPINRSSQVKMAFYQAKMAKVKPKIDAINTKFAKDPKRKQQETMKLYKEHKISPPLGGCLPMLLQFPVFIGLFAALRSSLLLRQKPFVAWVQDLSRPDAMIDFGGPIADFPIISSVTTFNLLPIVMVVLWVLHQRSMPKSQDPQQAQMQKMMTFMPILFGVMLYNYAAGLSLYMITSSFVGIFESKVIKKKWPVPTPGQPSKGGA